MKFGASLNYLATWLGMLAAGSWTLPVFTLSVAPRTAEAVPMTSGSDDDGWTGSEVANAWALATGSEYTPASQVLALHSGADHSPVLVDRVSVDDGTSLGLSWFMVDHALPMVENLQSDQDGFLSTRAELVTGRVLGSISHPGFFSAIRFSMTGSIGLSGEGEGAESTVVLTPIAAFQSHADATSFHQTLVRASEGGGTGEGHAGLDCMNPNWRGFNGVECCRFEAALNLRLDGCESGYWAALLACVVGSLTIACPATWACMKACIPICSTVFACKLCVGACGIAGLATLVGAMYLCAKIAQHNRSTCRANAMADYVVNLASNGCPSKPGTTGASLTAEAVKVETLEVE